MQVQAEARARAASARGADLDTAVIHAGIAAVQRLAEAYLLRRGQLAAAVDLTEQQWAVLEEIATEHFMPSMFARRRQSSAAAISKTLRQLLTRGLVAVAVGREDGRHRRYTLTAAGRALMGRLRAERQRAIDRIWRRLDRRELALFTEFSNRLAGQIEAYAGSKARRAPLPEPDPP